MRYDWKIVESDIKSEKNKKSNNKPLNFILSGWNLSDELILMSYPRLRESFSSI